MCGDSEGSGGTAYSKLHLKRLFWHMPLPLSHGLVNSDLDLQCLP